MDKNAILKMLIEKGFDANMQKINKNGKIFNGISIKPNNGKLISPVIYLDSFEGTELSDNEICNEIITIYYNNMDNLDWFDINYIKNYEDIKCNIFIGICKDIDNNQYSLPFYDLRKYLYIQISNEATVNITTDLINKYLEDNNNLTIADIWNAASDNMLKEINIFTLFDFTVEKIMTEDNIPREIAENMVTAIFGNKNMVILSNNQKIKGAGMLTIPDALCELAEKCNSKKIFILPSSIHELIGIEYEDGVEQELLNMVKNVNSEQVKYEEQLNNTIYVFDAVEMKIERIIK